MNNPMLNIFLIAPMGAGKDTVADHLQVEWGYGSVSLGGAVRNAICDINPYYKHKSNRELEKDFAESHKRWFGDDHWCKAVMPSVMHNNFSLNRPVVVRDGRFQAEYDYFVTQRGFIPVKIMASEEVRIERLVQRDFCFNAESFHDPKDCAILGNEGYTINNDSDSHVELYDTIDNLMRQLRS